MNLYIISIATKGSFQRCMICRNPKYCQEIQPLKLKGQNTEEPENKDIDVFWPYFFFKQITSGEMEFCSITIYTSRAFQQVYGMQKLTVEWKVMACRDKLSRNFYPDRKRSGLSQSYVTFWGHFKGQLLKHYLKTIGTFVFPPFTMYFKDPGRFPSTKNFSLRAFGCGL